MRKNLSEWGSFYWVTPIVIISLLLVAWVDRKRWKKPVAWSMLSIWVIAVTYLMFLYRLPRGYAKVSLDFLHMYRAAGEYCGSINTNQALRQILFNMLLYIPLGSVLATITGKGWISILIGIGISILTECLQYLIKLGMTDVDDVISNVIGVTIGVTLFSFNRRLFSKDQDKRNRVIDAKTISSMNKNV